MLSKPLHRYSEIRIKAAEAYITSDSFGKVAASFNVHCKTPTIARIVLMIVFVGSV